MAQRWLVTGATGQLGSELVRALTAARTGGADPAVVLGVGHGELDIGDPGAVDAAIAAHRPDVVVNTAAYTAVDAAETDEVAAARVNAAGPAHLAAACAEHGAALLQLSTDYVFGGDADRPYETTDTPAPRTAYGRTKLAGERAVTQLLPGRSWILRTAWVYGAGGSNFVRAMVRAERSREYVDVVADQTGSPTWTGDLAAAIRAMVEQAPPAGIYHCTGTGATTWCGLAKAVFTELGADPARVRPISSAQLDRPAPRPAYAVLSNRSWRSAGLPPMPAWADALRAGLPGIVDTEPAPPS